MVRVWIVVAAVLVAMGCRREPTLQERIVLDAAKACRPDRERPPGELISARPLGVREALSIYRASRECDEACRRETTSLLQEPDPQLLCQGARVLIERHRGDPLDLDRLLMSHWVLLACIALVMLGARGRENAGLLVIGGALTYGLYRGLIWIASAIAWGVWLALGVCVLMIAGGVVYARLDPRHAGTVKVVLSVPVVFFGVLALVERTSVALAIAAGAVATVAMIINIGEGLRERKPPPTV